MRHTFYVFTLIILAIVVMLFGTKRLKSIGSDLGNAVKGFRSAMSQDEAEKDEELKKKATVRLHLEVNPEVVRRSQMVPIIRSHPIMLNMADDYIIHEGYLEKATMVNTPEGGFAIKLE